MIKLCTISTLMDIVPKERSRSSRSGHHYTPKRTREFEASLRGMAVLCMEDPASCPMFVVCDIQKEVPKSWPKWKREAALDGLIFPQRGDWDNMAKAMTDACNGVVYIDDRQVMGAFVTKRYATDPVSSITFYKVGDPEYLVKESTASYVNPRSCFGVGK